MTFDLLTPKVDGFMPLPRGAKSVYSFTKYRVFTSFATNEMTDGQTNERKDDPGTTCLAASLVYRSQRPENRIRFNRIHVSINLAKDAVRTVRIL